MSVDWSFVRLKDYCTKIGSGSTPRGGANVYLDSGNVCLIRSQNIYNDGFSENGLVFISDSDAEKLNNVEIELNDVLINITGDSVARVCLAPKDKLPARVNQHVAIIRTVKNELDPKFVRYFLTDRNTQNHLLTLAGTGATRNALTKGMLEEFLVPKPDILIQKKISKILSDLDEKIHLNNQINQTLESIAQTIFKSWYIDFDPVRAKIAAKLEGADPEIAAMCVISGKSEAELKQMPDDDFAELQATAALFPDELVESELGEVPKGWELQEIKDIAKYGSNKIPLNDLTLENYISTENMLSEKKGIEKASSLPKVNSVPAFKKQNILVSNIRPYFKKIWFSSFEGGHSNDVLNFEVLEKGSEEYLYNLIYQDSFFDQMMASSKGSKMPRGDKKAIMNFQVVTPSIILRKLYSEKIRKFYLKQNIIKKENQDLTDIRDALLPKLLSGEVEVENR